MILLWTREGMEGGGVEVAVEESHRRHQPPDHHQAWNEEEEGADFCTAFRLRPPPPPPPPFAASFVRKREQRWLTGCVNKQVVQGRDEGEGGSKH